MKGRLGLAKISFLGLSVISAAAATPPLRFDRDTVGFANMTMFEYENGIAHVRRGESANQKRYTRRCFVLCRTTMQFKKFARFELHGGSAKDRKSTRLNSSHRCNSYAVFCLNKKI